MSSSVFNRVISAIIIAALLPADSLPVMAQEASPPSVSESADAPPPGDLPAEDSGRPALEPEPETTDERDQADDSAVAPANDEAQASTAAAAGDAAVPPDVGTKATSEADLVGTGGEYVYTFPFDLPEYHDLVPDLRLRYNSSRQDRGGPDNIVAFGWRLGGLSRIERVSLGGGVPTYDDGQDFYRLDGADLMACNDTAATNKWTRHYPLKFLTQRTNASCTAGGNLSTRVESGAKIRYVQSGNEFFVTRPNGVQYRYQSIGDLAGDVSTSGPQFNLAHQNRWVLTEIRDTQKNSSGVPTNVVTLQYAFGPLADGYPERISTISYGGYRVVFGYTNWDRASTFGTGTGILGQQRHRLGWVAVYDGANKIRAYGLETMSSAQTSTTRLQTVRSYGNDFTLSGGTIASGTQLPATSFEYSADVFSFTEKVYNNTEFHHANMIADLDYDGGEELAFVARTMQFDDGDGIQTRTLKSGRYKIGLNRAIADISPVSLPCGGTDRKDQFDNIRSAGSDRSVGSVQLCASISYNNPAFPTNDRTADLNTYQIGSGNLQPVSSYAVRRYHKDDPLPEVPLVYRQENLDPRAEFWTGSHDKKALFGDWTGDGVTDTRFADSISSFLPEPGFLHGVNRPAGEVWSRDVSGPFPASFPSNLGFFKVYPSVVGDFNGDGLDDVSYKDSVLASTGLEFTTTSQTSPYREEIDRPNITQTADINADGLDDIIIHNGFSDQYPIAFPYSYGTAVYLNTGSSFGRLFFDGSTTISDLVGVGDFDGDGLTDLLIGGEPGKILFGEGGVPHLLTAVNGGRGERTEITYSPSTRFGYNQAPGVQQVATQISVRDGRGGPVRTVGYDYSEGRYDFINRKPLGFKTIGTQLPAIAGETVGPKIVTTYLNGSMAVAGKVSSRVMTDAASTVQYRLNNFFDIINEGNGPWKAEKTQERVAVRYDNELIETRKDFAWTLYGQLLSEATYGYTRNGVNVSGNDDVTMSYGYLPNLSAYIADRPWTVRLQRGLESSTDRNLWLKADYFHYDGADTIDVAPNKGNLTEHVVWTGNPANLNKRLASRATYDAYGNILTETDARENTTRHGYDPARNLFRISTRNPRGHETATSWHAGCQLPREQRDANDLATNFSYDLHCREVLQTLPNGQYIKTTYNQLGDAALQNIRRESRSASMVAGRLLTYEWEFFDGLGRVYKTARTASTSVQADAITLQMSYDARGNLTYRSNPRLWSDATGTPPANQRTDFLYDTLNRPLRETYADATYSTTDYVTTNIASYGVATPHPGTRLKDAHCYDAAAAGTVCGEVQSYVDHGGRLVRETRTDFAGTDVTEATTDLRYTQFGYDRLGQLITVVDPENIQWAYTYDIYGNRLTSDDPGLGLWTMTYDENNNLLRQTDAKGQVIASTYDALNRVTLKQVGVGANRVETRFTYDQARTNGNNIGKETTQEVWTPVNAGTTVHKVERDYHVNGQVQYERHMIDGRTYPLQFSYRPTGDFAGKYLPRAPGSPVTMGWIANYEYDAGNRITSFGDFITSVTYDVWNNPKRTEFGNGAFQTASYDSQRGWPIEINGFNSADDKIFRAAYTRTATGRIGSYDTMFTWEGVTSDREGSFAYTYDYTSRLLRATNTRDQTAYNQVFSYDRAGRMRTKGRNVATATSYVYNNQQPAHAPLRVMAGGVTQNFAYDANGNMTTGLNGKVMTYDGENRPLSVTANGQRTCYIYGVDGARLKKVEGLAANQNCAVLPAAAGPTVYFGDVEIRNWGFAGQETVSTYPDPSVKLRDGNQPAQASYLHRDHLGSVRAITGPLGGKAESAVYQPFGEQTSWQSPIVSEPESKGWIGERYDADAGLQYLNARYYDPELSLFLQPDWFEVTKPGVGTNRYAYSFNDPINLRDPEGNQAFSDWGKDQDEADSDNAERASRHDAIAKDIEKEETWGDWFRSRTGGVSRHKRAAQEYRERIGVSRTERIIGDILGIAGEAAMGVMPARTAGAALAITATALGKQAASATSINASVALRTKLTALENAQARAVQTRTLPDGRVRYYSAEVAATKPGPSRGASYVTEWNPKTGAVRGWYETRSHTGTVNRIHPKMIDGQRVDGQHYPPTAKDLGR